MYERASIQHRIKKESLIFVLCLGCILGYISCSGNGSSAIYRGMVFTAQTIIPSIFPVMLISDILSRSGVLATVCSGFAPVMKKAKLNPALLPPIAVGAFCGFPAGAKCVRASVEQGLITNREADCILAASNCAGPAFVISAVGVGMYSDAKIGVLLWLVSFFLCCVMSYILVPKQKDPRHSPNCAQSSAAKSLSSLFCESIKSTSLSIMNLFFMITFFYALCRNIQYVLIGAGVDPLFSAAGGALLEIGSGCSSAMLLPAPYSLCLTAFSVGFGGSCVFFQVKNEAHKNADMRLYLTTKAVCGLISSFFAYFLLQS